MIRVIGTTNCPRCNMTKDILEKRNVDYTYCLIDDLSSEEQDKFLNMGRMSGQMSFPLIIKNDKIITLQEA